MGKCKGVNVERLPIKLGALWCLPRKRHACQPQYGTEHLLLGLIHEGEGGARALESLGVTLNAIREQVQDIAAPAPGT